MTRKSAVLMYHDVSAAVGQRYTVSRERLVRDLEATRGPGEVDVELTFDDGRAGTFLHGLPILVEHRAEALLFVATGLLGRAGFMEPSMVRAWHRAGQRVGSHGVTHRPFPLLRDDEVRSELADSKARLEDLLGCEITTISLPGGGEDPRVRSLAFAAGYARVYTSRPAFARPGDRVVPRFAIRAETPAGVVAALRRGSAGTSFYGDSVRWAAKRALGVPLYHAMTRTVRGLGRAARHD